MAIKIGDTVVISDTGGLTGSGLTYPVVDGTAGQFMTTDGNGNLSFASVVVPTSKVGISSTVVDTPVSEVQISLDGLQYDRYELELFGVTSTGQFKLRWRFTDANGDDITPTGKYKNSNLDVYQSTEAGQYTFVDYTEVNRYLYTQPDNTYGGITATYKFERMKQPPAYLSGFRIRWTMSGGYVASGTLIPVSMTGFGYLDQSFTETTKPTGIRFDVNSGTIDSGTFNLYGLNDPS